MIEAIRAASGRVTDQDLYDGTASMYHIPDLGTFLKCILPELARRAAEAKCQLPLELGISQGRPALDDSHPGQALPHRARQAQPPALESRSARPSYGS